MNYTFSEKIANLKPSSIREIFKNLTDPSVISFGGGNPAPESFPVQELKKLAADIFENDSVTALQYNITEGYPLYAIRLKTEFIINLILAKSLTILL